MRSLYELAARNAGEKGVTVAWEEFEHGNHNDTCVQPDYFDRIGSWWEASVAKADPYVPTGRLGALQARDSVEKSDGENIYRVESATAGRSLSDTERSRPPALSDTDHSDSSDESTQADGKDH
ncbi:bem46 protein, variant [Coemansia helicoidea]|uniref:Bem46 protein, variant n=1 Tax=Coemansia helicoidea TaxID=1286919 RepID=A0ACC1KR84_9FUNG|nr:bem46 protein, variant [Coemansia helicoidea]